VNEAAANDEIELRCLSKGPKSPKAPDGLGRDLMRLLALPEGARNEFWQVLSAYLKPRLNEEAQHTIVSFCTRHELTTDDLAPIIKATRFLFQETARSGISPQDFALDVSALAPPDEARDLATLMMPWLDDFMPQLRQQVAHQSIADHGKLVVDTHWRLDRVTSSDRGTGETISVAVVTFSYVEGERAERITLHMMPEQLVALRHAADEMLG
jgi:hypothetical protein